MKRKCHYLRTYISVPNKTVERLFAFQITWMKPEFRAFLFWFKYIFYKYMFSLFLTLLTLLHGRRISAVLGLLKKLNILLSQHRSALNERMNMRRVILVSAHWLTRDLEKGKDFINH